MRQLSVNSTCSHADIRSNVSYHRQPSPAPMDPAHQVTSQAIFLLSAHGKAVNPWERNIGYSPWLVEAAQHCKVLQELHFLAKHQATHHAMAVGLGQKTTEPAVAVRTFPI